MDGPRGARHLSLHRRSPWLNEPEASSASTLTPCGGETPRRSYHLPAPATPCWPRRPTSGRVVLVLRLALLLLLSADCLVALGRDDLLPLTKQFRVLVVEAAGLRECCELQGLRQGIQPDRRGDADYAAPLGEGLDLLAQDFFARSLATACSRSSCRRSMASSMSLIDISFFSQGLTSRMAEMMSSRIFGLTSIRNSFTCFAA
jgi:hypothetical protein